MSTDQNDLDAPEGTTTGDKTMRAAARQVPARVQPLASPQQTTIKHNGIADGHPMGKEEKGSQTYSKGTQKAGVKGE